jgi:hypothetical protein
MKYKALAVVIMLALALISHAANASRVTVEDLDAMFNSMMAGPSCSDSIQSLAEANIDLAARYNAVVDDYNVLLGQYNEMKRRQGKALKALAGVE